MAARIDPVLTEPLRLAGSSLKVRALSEAPRVARADVDARASAASRLDSFQFSSPVRTTMPTADPAGAASKMVAATVPGSVDFLADTPPISPISGAMPMYRHPADRNAAATGVDAGRVLDIEG
jgi:hypothetical protein